MPKILMDTHMKTRFNNYWNNGGWFDIYLIALVITGYSISIYAAIHSKTF